MHEIFILINMCFLGWLHLQCHPKKQNAQSMHLIVHEHLFVLELLRKDFLPNFHPLLLLGSQCLSWILKGPCHDISQFRSQYLDDEHGLPVRYCETSPVPVKNEHTGKHLSNSQFVPYDLKRSIYITTNITAE